MKSNSRAGLAYMLKGGVYWQKPFTSTSHRSCSFGSCPSC